MNRETSHHEIHDETSRVPGRLGKTMAKIKRSLPMVRRGLLAGTLLAVVLALIPMEAGAEYPGKPALESLQQKLRQVDSHLTQGQPHMLRLTESELFWWLQTQNRQLQSTQNEEVEKPLFANLELEGVSVANNGLNLRTAFSLFGKKITLHVTGKPTLEHRYLDLDVDGARLGYLPIPSPVFSLVWKKLLDGPLGMRDRRLPVQVNQIELQQGELVVHYADFFSAIL